MADDILNPQTVARKLSRLQDAYHKFHNVRRRQWSREEDHREAAEDLRQAITMAQATTAELDKRPMTADLEHLRGDLVVYVTLAADDLKEQAAR